MYPHAYVNVHIPPHTHTRTHAHVHAHPLLLEFEACGSFYSPLLRHTVMSRYVRVKRATELLVYPPCCLGHHGLSILHTYVLLSGSQIVHPGKGVLITLPLAPVAWHFNIRSFGKGHYQLHGQFSKHILSSCSHKADIIPNHT